jgi:hypothetical protein
VLVAVEASHRQRRHRTAARHSNRSDRNSPSSTWQRLPDLVLDLIQPGCHDSIGHEFESLRPTISFLGAAPRKAHGAVVALGYPVAAHRHQTTTDDACAPAAGPCSNFLYVFKAARNGPLTPPTGRVPAGWRGTAEVGRADDRQSPFLSRWTWPAGDRQRPRRRGPAARPWPQGESRPSSSGCGGAHGVRAASPPSRALRVASDGHKPAALDGGGSAILSGQGSSGRPLACPQESHAATPITDSSTAPIGCQGCLNVT